jgi:hypothetical protein
MSLLPANTYDTVRVGPLLAGRPVDVAEHLAAVNAQRRVIATIGLERRARDVTPDPLAYARARAEEADR